MISLLMMLVLMCSFVPGAAALRGPVLIGDVDGDGSVTVLDATKLQRWLAGFEGVSKLGEYLGDVNGSGCTDIIDATCIQLKLADLGAFRAAYYGSYFIEDYRFYADYNSGKARVGTPVTFHCDAIGVDWSSQADAFAGGLDPERADLPMTYAFYINGECVQQCSENNELVYTFTEAGTYRITAEMFNALDYRTVAYINSYSVVEPYSLDRPVVVSTLFPEDTRNAFGRSPLVVRAEGGDGDYRYMYTIEYGYTGYENDGFFVEEPIDEYSVPVISTGYIDSSELKIPSALYNECLQDGERRMTVYARDGKGNVSDPVTVYYRAGFRIG